MGGVFEGGAGDRGGWAGSAAAHPAQGSGRENQGITESGQAGNRLDRNCVTGTKAVRERGDFGK